MEIDSTIEEGERSLAQVWKVIALQGALAIVVGVVLLAWPGIGLTALIALFGAFAIVTGVATLFEAFSVQLEAGDRAWLVVDGLVGIVVGVLVFAWPNLSALALLYAVAAFAIVAGVLEIGASFTLPLSGGRSLLLMLGGLLSTTFGVIMFAHPGAGALALLTLIAAFAIVTGVMEIAYAIELRSVAAEVKQRFSPQATTKPVAH